MDLLFRPERILLNVLPVMCALSELATASGHGLHLAKQDRLIVAYRVFLLFSRFGVYVGEEDSLFGLFP
jgi:hypothetical protein